MLSAILFLWDGQLVSWEHHTCIIASIYMFSVLDLLDKLILML